MWYNFVVISLPLFVLTAIFTGGSGLASTRMSLHSRFCWSWRRWSWRRKLELEHVQSCIVTTNIPTPSFLQARCPPCHPTNRKGIWPVKSWVSVRCWWRFDWSFARLVALSLPISHCKPKLVLTLYAPLTLNFDTLTRKSFDKLRHSLGIRTFPCRRKPTSTLARAHLHHLHRHSRMTFFHRLPVHRLPDIETISRVVFVRKVIEGDEIGWQYIQHKKQKWRKIYPKNAKHISSIGHHLLYYSTVSQSDRQQCETDGWPGLTWIGLRNYRPVKQKP